MVDLVSDHVLEPAGMIGTRLARMDKDQAPAYDRQAGQFISRPFPNPPRLAAGGGNDTTGADMIALAKALAGGVIVSKEVLTSALFARDSMVRMGGDADGEGHSLGAMVVIFGQTQTFGHPGGGGLAAFRYEPKSDTAIIVLTNRRLDQSTWRHRRRQRPWRDHCDASVRPAKARRGVRRPSDFINRSVYGVKLGCKIGA